MDLAHISDHTDSAVDAWLTIGIEGLHDWRRGFPLDCVEWLLAILFEQVLWRARYGCIHLDLFAVGEFLCLSAYFLLIAGGTW